MRRHKHNLSFDRNTTFNPGELVPIGLVPVLPGDIFRHQTSALLRFSPTLAPVMHMVDVRIHHFYVPLRLLWYPGSDAAPNDLGFETFITGGQDGNDVQTIPTIATAGGNNAKAGLLDYLGVPTGTTGINVNSLPVRAYNMIYNEWYRDQDLISEVSQDTTTVQKIAWEKDYLTSARSSEQKGSDVTVPLANATVQVTSAGTGIPKFNVDNQTAISVGAPGTSSDNARWSASPADAGEAAWNDPELEVILNGVNAIDVNDLRLSLALQRFKERRSMYGSRYSEYLASIGVRSSDGRINRPEYLGGGRQTVSFSEVLNTAATAANDLGEFGGHGISAVRSNRYRRYFEEHGYVMTLMSVRPRAVYADACPKEFLKQDKEDFYQKELELIGQQAVLNNEAYFGHTTGSGTFGYADRYREYREVMSQVNGDFRDSILNHWSWHRDLTSDPSLNQTFIECAPSNRIFAVTTDDLLWVKVHHSIGSRRMVLRKPQPRIF